MRAGRLDRRISLQTATDTQDSYGQAVSVWATTYTVWADVWPLPYTEQVEGDRKTEGTMFKIRIRYQSGVIPTMRVVYGSSYYDIVSINEGNRQEYLDLIVRLDRNMT